MNAIRKSNKQTALPPSPWKRCMLGLAGCVVALSLTACNTMEGAGEDVEKAGEKIQDAAD